MAKEKNIKRIFNGQAGNFTFSWNGPYVEVSNFFRGHFLRSYKNLRHLSIIFNTSIFSVFKAQILYPMYRILYLKWNMVSGFIIKRDIQHSFTPKSFFNKIELTDIRENLKKWPNHSTEISESKLRKLYFLNLAGYVGGKWYSGGQDYALEFSDPTSERRFVEFSFSIPQEEFNKKGIPRYLASRILTDKLKKKYHNLNRRISQSYDIGLRLQNDSCLKKLIDDFKKKHQGTHQVQIDALDSLYLNLINNEDLNEKQKLSMELLKIISIIFFFEKTNLSY